MAPISKGPTNRGASFREATFYGRSFAESQTFWPGTYRGAGVRWRLACRWERVDPRSSAARALFHVCWQRRIWARTEGTEISISAGSPGSRERGTFR